MIKLSEMRKSIQQILAAGNWGNMKRSSGFTSSQRSLLNEIKATQVAGRFLELAGGSANYMLILKLMYLTDRAALTAWDRPVTNDTYWSLKHGPILSSVYDLIANEPATPEEGFWSSHISAPNVYVVTLKHSAGNSELSSAEEHLISDIHNKYGAMNPFALAAKLHTLLPEWRDPAGSRLPIRLHDILLAIGRSVDEAAEIESEIRSIETIESIFAKRS